MGKVNCVLPQSFLGLISLQSQWFEKCTAKMLASSVVGLAERSGDKQLLDGK